MKPLVWLRACVGLAAPLAAAPAALRVPMAEPPHPESVPLWANGAPGSESHRDVAEQTVARAEPGTTFPVTFSIHHPTVTPYLPRNPAGKTAAMIIAPGGGHQFLTVGREGYDVGAWLAAHGVAGFVLKYRLAKDWAGGSTYRADVEGLADAQRAVRLLRSRAAEWNIDPARIGFMGFSAGGEIAALVGTTPAPANSSAADPIDQLSGKPDFLVLMYPGLHHGFNVDQTTPPSFLAVADDDHTVHAETTANFYLQLHAAKVPAELHIFNQGGHGFGLRPHRQEEVYTWPDLVIEWMKDRGYSGR